MEAHTGCDRRQSDGEDQDELVPRDERPERAIRIAQIDIGVEVTVQQLSILYPWHIFSSIL